MESAPNNLAFGSRCGQPKAAPQGTYSGASSQKKSPDLSGLLET